MSKRYSIGLDIGTNSVGWAVTDEEDEFVKFKGKNMWGVRLFEEGTSAANTRVFRSTRRRLARRKERIRLLQEIFSEEMAKKDVAFFIRLEESKLFDEDRTIKRNGSLLFNDMTDSKYGKDYPTIYHLRESLLESNEKADIRFIYLALHHIVKYRGNFLYEGEFSESNSKANTVSQIEKVLEFLYEKNNDYDYEINTNKLASEMTDILEKIELTNMQKKEAIVTLLTGCKLDKKVAEAVTKLMIGYKAKLKIIFDIEDDKDVTFKEEQVESEIESLIGEEYYIYENLKNIYDWYILRNILSGGTNISSAMISKYEKHKKDLQILKNLIRKYARGKYQGFFRDGGDNTYVSYINKASKAKRDDFYKEIKKILDKKPGIESDEEYIYCVKSIENLDFLPKVTSVDNAAVPYQLNKNELVNIIDKQAKYYPFLNEEKEKIISILTFKIPYYVGPLNPSKEKFGWAIRKNEGKIYPWNFSDMIDKEACAEKFILRMTNKCMYLPEEDVIPKNSLLYSEYCVLNELNKIKIGTYTISYDAKIKVFDGLFKKNKKITAKKLKEFLKNNNLMNGDPDVSGFQKENEFATSLTSYIDFNNILGDVESNREMIEEIIRWITIFNEKDIIKKKINDKYPQINEEQVKRILKLNYTGWSRLSKKLIDEITVKDTKNPLLRVSIIEKMRKSNLNFMEIINDKELGFCYVIEELVKVKDLNKFDYKDVADLAGSPALKRGIWQSLKVVDELVKIMKCEPENICIEVARSDEEKKRTNSRVKRLKEAYKKLKEETNEYNREIERELNGYDKIDDERLLLYFSQNGKCMYSGRPLEIANLSLYQVDHIIPQSIIKDDSIDNKALVYGDYNQYKTDALVIDSNIRHEREDSWKSLNKAGLISLKKFSSLTRDEYDEKIMDKFIQRQLVETRQITKHVANILQSRYEDTKVINVKAGLNSELRKRCGFLKIRELNDFHHAQDAYITIVVGKYMREHCYGLMSGNNSQELKEVIAKVKMQKAKEKERKNSGEETKSKDQSGYIINGLKRLLDAEWTDYNCNKATRMRKLLSYRDCNVVKKLEEGTGEFYNQTVYSPKDAKIPMKGNLDENKYGGYSGVNKAYLVVIEYLNKKNRVKKLVSMPIHISKLIQAGKMTMEEYYEKEGYTDVKILCRKIYKNQLVLEKGKLEFLASDSEIHNAIQLVLKDEYRDILYKIVKGKETPKGNQVRKETEEELIKLYDELINKIQCKYENYKNVGENLLSKKEKFIKLDYEKKEKIILEILKLLNANACLANLKEIELAPASGRINARNVDVENTIFISQSVTGLFERRYRI